MLSFPHRCLCTISLYGIAHLAEIGPLEYLTQLGFVGVWVIFSLHYFGYFEIPEARKRMIGRVCSVYFKFSINYQISINSCYRIHNFNWYWILCNLDKLADAYMLLEC